MTDKIMAMWFIMLVLGLSIIAYRALMALDFSRLFRANSSWQIRLLCLLGSVALSFLVASAILDILENLLILLQE